MKNSLYIHPTHFEALEPRIAPATIVVLNDADNGAGSLRQAILDANATPAKDTIVFDPTFFSTPKKITLTTGDLDITESVTIKGVGADLVTVDGNSASRVFNVDDGTSAIKKVAISGLTISGGNINSNGGGILNKESLTVTDSVIVGNLAVNGGGIASSSSGKVIIKDTQIVENTSLTKGGGIYLFSFGKGSATISNVTIVGNISGGSGGGLHATASSDDKVSLVIDKSNILSNTANTGGGASVEIQSTPTVITVKDTVISGNSASASEGGLKIVHDNSSVGSKIFLDKVTVSENRALTAGGIGIKAGELDSVTIKNSEIVSNHATNGTGGGLKFSGEVAPVLTSTSISGNTATGNGGGIHANGGGFKGQSLKLIGNSSGYDGGAVYSYVGSINISKSTFEANTAVNGGGAVSVDGFATLTLSNSKLIGNSAESIGGALQLRGSDVLIQKTSFTGNFATFDGGAISGFFDGDLKIQSSTFTGNKAGGSGGMGYLYIGGSLEITSSTISGNHAGDRGGGLIIFSVTGSSKITKSTISGNAAGGAGGGVYTGSINPLQVLGSKVSGNRSGVGGGGIFNIDADPVVITGSSITGNSAPTDPNIRGPYTI